MFLKKEKKKRKERKKERNLGIMSEEKAKARSEDAGGVLGSFVEECALDVLHAVGEGVVLLLKGIVVLLEAMDSVLLTQRSHAQQQNPRHRK